MVLLSLIAGILCGYAAMRGFVWIIWVLISLIALGAVLFLLIKKILLGIACLIACIVVLTGFFNFNLNFYNYTSTFFADKNCKITGKLTDYYAEYEDSIFVVLKDSIIYSDGDIESTNNKNIGVWIYFDEDIQSNFIVGKVGNFIEFDCILNNAPIFVDGINTFYLKNDIGFIATSVKNIIVVEGGRPAFDELLRENIRNTLKTKMTEETSSVAIALLLGSKSAITQDLENGYRNMGISHIFAVSGLHIGFIYSVIGYFTYKLRIKKWKALPIVFFPMLFYSWICGFSASVVRAFIMASCSLVFQAIGCNNDSISSISFAALVILFISPLYLFDAGFLMSFSAVIGINCISRVILRHFFTENKFLEFLTNTVFVSFGASIGVMGLVAHFYGKITLWGFLFNIIITPFITVIFVLLIIGLIPFMNFILVIPKYFFVFTNFIAQKFANIQFGTFSVKSFGIVLLLLFLAMFVFGEYFNLGKKLKYLVIGCLVSAFLLSGIIISLPKSTNYAIHTFDVNSDYGYVITDDKNTAYIFSDLDKEYEANQFLNFCIDNNISNVYVFTMDYHKLNVDNITSFIDMDMHITAIYSFANDFNIDADLLLDSIGIDKFAISNNNKLELEEFTILPLTESTSKAWYVRSEEINVLFCKEMTVENFSYIYRHYVDRVDLIFSSLNEEYILANSDAFAVITNNYVEAEGVISLKIFGKLTVQFNSARIMVIP